MPCFCRMLQTQYSHAYILYLLWEAWQSSHFCSPLEPSTQRMIQDISFCLGKYTCTFFVQASVKFWTYLAWPSKSTHGPSQIWTKLWNIKSTECPPFLKGFLMQQQGPTVYLLKEDATLEGEYFFQNHLELQNVKGNAFWRGNLHMFYCLCHLWLSYNLWTCILWFLCRPY